MGDAALAPDEPKSSRWRLLRPRDVHGLLRRLRPSPSHFSYSIPRRRAQSSVPAYGGAHRVHLLLAPDVAQAHLRGTPIRIAGRI